MNNKLLTFFIIISIIIFVIVVNYFIEPIESESSGPYDPGKTTKLKKEFDQLNIDYLNLKWENEKLEQENESLHDSIFEATKFILESDIANEFIPESTEIIHKEIGENKFIILYKIATGYRLVVSLRELRFGMQLEFDTLNPESGFNWQQSMGPDFNIFGGIITDNQIKQVQVLQDDKVYKADIIKLTDNLYVWYSLLNYEKSSISDEPVNLKIEALNNDGVILLEEDLGNL